MMMIIMAGVVQLDATTNSRVPRTRFAMPTKASHIGQVQHLSDTITPSYRNVAPIRVRVTSSHEPQYAYVDGRVLLQPDHATQNPNRAV